MMILDSGLLFLGCPLYGLYDRLTGIVDGRAVESDGADFPQS